MADSRRLTPNPDVGVAGASSPSSSPARGPYVVADARPATSLSDLDRDLDGIVNNVSHRGPRCIAGAVLAELPEATRNRIIALLITQRPDGSVVSAPAISEVLRKHGYEVRADRLAFHRRGLLGGAGCACARD